MPLQLIVDDPWLEPYAQDIQDRLDRHNARRAGIVKDWGSLKSFANVHERQGLHYDAARKGWVYREWAPRAHMLALIGEFNDWDPHAHPLRKNERGVWESFIPDGGDGPVLKHGDAFKVQITGANGIHDRLPACVRYVTQDEESKDFTARVWHPGEEFVWSDDAFDPGSLGAPLIYECHVGMAQEKEGVGNLPGVHRNRAAADRRRLGYNCIQMMAVARASRITARSGTTSPTSSRRHRGSARRKTSRN